jgi:hypothetical protein
MAASWGIWLQARFMVCVGGVEVTKFFREECQDGCVAAAPRGGRPSLIGGVCVDTGCPVVGEVIVHGDI